MMGPHRTRGRDGVGRACTPAAAATAPDKPSAADSLRAAQRARIVRRDADCRRVGISLASRIDDADIRETGPNVAARCLFAMTTQRAFDLRDIRGA